MMTQGDCRWVALCMALLFLTGCSGARETIVYAVDGPADRSLGPGTSSVQLMVEPHDGVRPLLRLVNRARERILVTAYILSDRRVERALERAATQGVDVRVLLEHHPYGLGRQPEDMADRLRAAAVHVRWSRPGLLFTHAKYLVLDDKIAVVSTANLSRSAFTHNREFLVVDRRASDVVAVSNIFRTDWDRSRVELRDPNLVVSPANSRSKLTRLVRSARYTIEVYAEEIADPSLEQVLGMRARAGVRVRVLVPVTASGAGLLALRGQHVGVRTLGNPYAHAKVIVVDGREAFVGSENISTTSLDRNRELGLLVQGLSVRTMQSIFKADWIRAAHVP